MHHPFPTRGSSGLDGMVASLAGAVVEAGGVLGIVPSGRGNDFARQLGVGGSPEQVAATLLDAAPRPVDVIDVGGRVVVGSVYAGVDRSEEHTSELQSLMRISYAVFCLKKKN